MTRDYTVEVQGSELFIYLMEHFNMTAEEALRVMRENDMIA